MKIVDASLRKDGRMDGLGNGEKEGRREIGKNERDTKIERETDEMI